MLFDLFFFQVFGALRMSVKMFLMWNSKMVIDGGGDQNVETTMVEASNLIVLKVLFLFRLLFFLVVFTIVHLRCLLNAI